jgi:hypothetical protein
VAERLNILSGGALVGVVEVADGQNRPPLLELRLTQGAAGAASYAVMVPVEIPTSPSVAEQLRADFQLAERMFIAYNGEPPNPWKTFDGRPVPDWSMLGEQVKAKWAAAARAAREALAP